MAEWERKRLEIVRGEQPGGVDEDGFAVFKTASEQFAHYAELQERNEHRDSPLAPAVPYDLWKEYQEFKEWRTSMAQSKRQAEARGSAMTPPAPSGAKPFRELTAFFRSHLELRLRQTKPGLKSKSDLSESRFHQYGIALTHMDTVIGAHPIEALGDFHVAEKQLASLLGRYREHCIEEMTQRKLTGHWFNERMKTARALVRYLSDKRLVPTTPPDIASLTEKYRIEPNPTPVKLPILRAMWEAADSTLQGFVLLALNCGFRQTEIYSLKRNQLRDVSGQLCVVKRRNKTGVPIAIPLWQATQRFLEARGKPEGELFVWESSKRAMSDLGYRMKKLREKVGRTHPSAKEYSFENFRDTGASFMDTVNSMLTPLYLGQGDTRQAKQYVAAIEDEAGQPVIPMQLDKALAKFESYLGLPEYTP